MGEFFLSGSQAATFLDRLLVNRVGQLPVGKRLLTTDVRFNGRRCR